MKIKDDCGVWIDDHKLIVDKFITDFNQRYLSTHRNLRLPDLGLSKLITDSDNDELIKPPNIEDIRAALFSIDSFKTPGLDGFGAGFFKNYWHIIKKDLFNGVSEFFTNCKMLKEINQTFIMLIAKVPNPFKDQPLQNYQSMPNYL